MPLFKCQTNLTYLCNISLGTAGGNMPVPGMPTGMFILTVFSMSWLSTAGNSRAALKSAI